MDLSRRSFIKHFGFTIAAVSCPVDFSGTKVIKLEKRFAPGEFVFFKYGPNDPITLLTDDNVLHFRDKIAWDDTSDRCRLFKDILICSYKQLQRPDFEKYVASIFDFTIAIDSCLEASSILLNAIDATCFYAVRKLTADTYIASPNFEKWRAHHKELLLNKSETEDAKTQLEYIRHPENFKEYQFTEDEQKLIEKIVTNPDHWLFPFLKEAGELKPNEGEYRVY